MNKKIEKVIEYINNAMALRPQYTQDMLYTEGTDDVIFYMNGNDGTDFDWKMNNRSCEFMVFFKETEMGFIKVYVNSDDTISGYLYEIDYKYGDEPLKLEEEYLNSGDAKYIAALMYNIADEKNIYDKSLDQMQTDYQLSGWQIYDFESYDDDDDDDDWN